MSSIALHSAAARTLGSVQFKLFWETWAARRRLQSASSLPTTLLRDYFRARAKAAGTFHEVDAFLKPLRVR